MAVPESSLDPASSQNLEKSQKIDKKLLLTAQDIKYAKHLAGNEKKSRSKALKSLKKWFEYRCKSTTMPLNEAELLIIWKGLFYSMWMSDKPLVQEECAENIAHLIHSLTPELGLIYYKCAMKTLGNEWFGIDQLRLDKFLMLVRRLLRQALVVLKNHNWKINYIRQFQGVLEDSVLSNTERVPLGLNMHFMDIFMEELSKVSEGEISPFTITEFLVPFAKHLSCLEDTRQISYTTRCIFRYLIKQSDLAGEYEEKFHAWKTMGFPGGHIDALQKEEIVKDSDESEEEKEEDEVQEKRDKVLDPRAGRVDVVLPQLKFNPKLIINLLNQHKFAPKGNRAAREAIAKLVDNFRDISRGKYPYGIKKMELLKKENPYESTKIKNAVNRLVKFEKKLANLEKKRKLEDELETDEIEDVKKVKLTNGDIKEEMEQEEIGKKRKKKNKKETHEEAVENVRKNKENGDCMENGKKKKIKVENGKDCEIVTSKEISLGTKKNNKVSKMNGDVGKGTKRQEVREDDEDVKRAKISRIPNKKDINYRNNTKFDMNESAVEKALTNLEATFQRNSGTWFVYSADQDESRSWAQSTIYEEPPKEKSPKKTKTDTLEITSPKTLNSTAEKKIPTPEKANASPEKKSPTPEKLKTSPSSENPISSTENIISSSSISVSPSRNSTPTKVSSPKDIKQEFSPADMSTPKRTIFSQSEWDTPLQEGEVEFFVPTNKHKKKMEKLAEQCNKTVGELLASTMNKIKGKSRHSMDPSLVRNPYSRGGTPGSIKKVKIDLRMNKSQEIHEHVARLRSSPAIPFDANKKPNKPLLKANAVASPINPFYRKKLNM